MKDGDVFTDGNIRVMRKHGYVLLNIIRGE